MRNVILRATAIMLAGLSAADALAQGAGGGPPSVTVVQWIRHRQGSPDAVLLDRTIGLTDKSAVTRDVYFEGDVVTFLLDIWDADWVQPIVPTNQNENVFLSFQLEGQPQ